MFWDICKEAVERRSSGSGKRVQGSAGDVDQCGGRRRWTEERIVNLPFGVRN